jgi:hypothetical protein
MFLTQKQLQRRLVRRIAEAVTGAAIILAGMVAMAAVVLYT